MSVLAFARYFRGRYGNLTVNPAAIAHNALDGKQGGTAGEYYHLTQAVHDALYSASPIIGLGSDGVTSFEVDYDSAAGATKRIEGTLAGKSFLKITAPPAYGDHNFEMTLGNYSDEIYVWVYYEPYYDQRIIQMKSKNFQYYGQVLYEVHIQSENKLRIEQDKQLIGPNNGSSILSSKAGIELSQSGTLSLAVKVKNNELLKIETPPDGYSGFNLDTYLGDTVNGNYIKTHWEPYYSRGEVYLNANGTGNQIGITGYGSSGQFLVKVTNGLIISGGPNNLQLGKQGDNVTFLIDWNSDVIRGTIGTVNNFYAIASETQLNSGTTGRISLTPSGMQLGTSGARVDTIETTLTDDDTHLPSSGAVYAAINAAAPSSISLGDSSVIITEPGNQGKIEMKVDNEVVFRIENYYNPQVLIGALPTESTPTYFQFEGDYGTWVFASLGKVFMQHDTGSGRIKIGGITDNTGRIDFNGSGAQIDNRVSGSSVLLIQSTGLTVGAIKSGATAGGAGATAGELWKTASHATLPDGVVMIA